MIWAWKGSGGFAARTLVGHHCAALSPRMARVQLLPFLAGLWSALSSCAHPQPISSESLARPSVPSALGTLTSHRRLTHVGDNPEHCTVGVAWFSLDQARMLEGRPFLSPLSSPPRSNSGSQSCSWKTKSLVSLCPSVLNTFFFWFCFAFGYISIHYK